METPWLTIHIDGYKIMIASVLVFIVAPILCAIWHIVYDFIYCWLGNKN